MKKINRLISLVIIFAFLVSFTGCSLRFTSFENLIRPPRLSGNYQELQDAFEASVDSSFTLITPENGSLQSSFLTYDIDSDGIEEAFVFYVLNDAPEIARVSYFRYIDDKWKHISTLEGLGDSVDKVIVFDLNGDGKSEILVGWSLYSNKINKIFSEYTLSENQFVQNASYPYTYFDILDVNGDGYNDVLSLTVDTSMPDKRNAVARVYTYDSMMHSLFLCGETSVDGNISSYSAITSESVSDKNIIYVEANKGVGESITEVLYWDDETNKLLSPLFDVSSQSTIQTWRNISLSVYDVDSDGYLEIPTSVEMPGSVVTVTDNSNTSSTVTSDNKPITQMYFTKWVKFRNDELEPVQYSIVNKMLGYMLNIKSTWVGKITVSGNDGQWDYYRWNSSTDSVGALLFSIYAYENTDTETAKKYSDYEVLKSTSSMTYVYKITSEGEKFNVSVDLLADNLVTSDFGGIQ